MPENIRATSFDGLFDGYAAADRYAVPKEDKELVDKLRKWFETSLDSKRYYEREWEVHRCYLKGEPIARHKETGEVIRLSVDEAKKQRASRNNMLRPISRSLVGKLAKMIPTCVVIPATSDFEEQHGARVGDAIFAYLRRKENLDEKYLEIMNYLPWAGNAFMQVSWDPSAGSKIAYCHVCNYYNKDIEMAGAPCPQCQAQRQQELFQQDMLHMQQTQQAVEQAIMTAPPGMAPNENDAVPPPTPPLQQTGALPTAMDIPILTEAFEGDVRFTVWDPRDVYVPPGITNIRTANRLCLRKPLEVAEARKRFPDFARFIRSEEGLYSDKMAHWRHNTLDTAGTIDVLSDHVYVYEFHERATEQYPKGRVIYMVNDMIVEESESPYHCLDRLPVFHFGFDVNDGEFWREAYLTHAWHRQRELDTLETQIREHMELLTRGKILIPMGSRISQDEISAYSAQLIEYNAAAGDPRPLDVPQLPQSAWQRKADLTQDMRMQASVTDQEQGLTTSDPNGRAMAIISAEADQQIGPITTRLHGEYRDAHRCALILVQKNYHPDRLITDAGPDGVQTFSFEELNLGDGFDVSVEESDGMSRNPAIRFNEILQLATVGEGAMFIDPQTGMFDKKLFSRMAKLKLPDQGYDLEAFNRAAAQSIPYLLMRGQQYQPRNFDNPQIFYEELLGWLQGPGRKADPELSMHVEQYWMYYASWVAALQSQMIAPGMAPPMQQQQGSQPGQGGMSAQGGSPNNPGSLGTDLAPGLQQQAQQQVNSADSSGEQLASSMGG